MLATKSLFEGIQRAGADVAEHHAQRAQRQRCQPAVMIAVFR